VAKANLGEPRRTTDKAGAWIYDIQNQQHLYERCRKPMRAAGAPGKYIVRGRLMAWFCVRTAEGTTWPTGSYGPTPKAIIHYRHGTPKDPYLGQILYREFLFPAAPPPHMQPDANQGTDRRIPLEFERIQPYVSPKIELSDQRTDGGREVLPVLSVQAAARYEYLSGATGDVLCGNE